NHVKAVVSIGNMLAWRDGLEMKAIDKLRLIASAELGKKRMPAKKARKPHEGFYPIGRSQAFGELNEGVFPQDECETAAFRHDGNGSRHVVDQGDFPKSISPNQG